MINKLKEYRISSGFNQNQLAYIVNVSRNTITSLECDVYKPGIILATKLDYVFFGQQWLCRSYQLTDEEMADVDRRLKEVVAQFPEKRKARLR